MRKLKLLFLALLVATVSFGQTYINAFKFTYPTTTSVSLTSPQSLNPTSYFSGAPGIWFAGGNPITTTNLTWTGLVTTGAQLNNLSTTLYTFTVDTSMPTVLGAASSPSACGICGIGTTGNVALKGADPTHPFLVQAGPFNAAGGQNAIQLAAQVTPANYEVYNAGVLSAQSSGAQLNTDMSGGGSTKSYGTVSFKKGFFANCGMEGFYFGSTHNSPNYTYFQNIIIEDWFVRNVGRNPFQLAHGLIQVDGVASVLSAVNNTGGQLGSIQLQDTQTGSYFKNFVIDSAKQAFEICASGLTVKNGIIWFDGVQSNILDMASNYFGTSSAQPSILTTGDTTFITDVDFVNYGATLSYLVKVFEMTHHYKFLRCRKSGVTNWYEYDGSASGHTSTVTIKQCSDFTPPPRPTFQSKNPSQPDKIGRVTSKDEYIRGRGPYTPRN